MLDRARRPAVVALALLALVLAWWPRVRAQTRELSVKDLLARVDAYMTDYKAKLKYVIAEERTTQQVTNWMKEVVDQRLTNGDLFVTFLPFDRTWLAIHDIAVVDGRPVDGHESLQWLVEHSTVKGVAQKLIDDNARYNIGGVTRNFNEPTLALLVLERDRRSSFKFERAKPAAAADSGTVVLRFRETESPALVRNGGRQIFATGELTIDPETGAIVRTSIQHTYEVVVSQLTTVYARDTNLDLWLPSAFTERYDKGAAPSPNRQVISVVSTYTNWRRFGATSRFTVQ